MAALPARLDHATPSLSGVFEQLLVAIVAGRYPSGTHLPAERDLARALGASRPTLREALRRLGEWGLIEVRRGSGILVRDLRDWSFDVLPTYLRVGPPAELVPIVRDLLALRRMILVDVVRLVAPRVGPGTLATARAAADRAFAARDDLGTFLREDFELIRAIPIAVKLYPALWMLNQLARVYDDLARTVQGSAMVPPTYLETYDTVFSALEAGDAGRACATLGGYLVDHDARLLAALEGRP